jgi:hypothetical protein
MALGSTQPLTEAFGQHHGNDFFISLKRLYIRMSPTGLLDIT